jgi:hypothetical protein
LPSGTLRPKNEFSEDAICICDGSQGAGGAAQNRSRLITG